MDPLFSKILENIDADNYSEAFEEFTTSCPHYPNCERGQQSHDNCVSTCLLPKLNHMNLESAQDDYKNYIEKIEKQLPEMGQSMLKHFSYSKIYTIGHQKIDQAHKELVGLINKMVDLYLVEDFDGCGAVFRDFKVKLQLHFYEEDIIMHALKFIDLDHDKLHDEIDQALDSLRDDYKTAAEWRSCIEILLDKFIVMILRHDFKFASYLETIGYKDEEETNCVSCPGCESCLPAAV